ncbi:MAG: hypothetical protein K6E58_00730 [Eubacterium sp.]|nr:hypothetical protein [Eubacterium sp.]
MQDFKKGMEEVRKGVEDFTKGIEVGRIIKKEKKDSVMKKVGIVAAIIAVVTITAGAVYSVYRLIDKIRYNDFEDDYDELFDDDDDDFEDE